MAEEKKLAFDEAIIESISELYRARYKNNGRRWAVVFNASF